MYTLQSYAWEPCECPNNGFALRYRKGAGITVSYLQHTDYWKAVGPHGMAYGTSMAMVLRNLWKLRKERLFRLSWTEDGVEYTSEIKALNRHQARAGRPMCVPADAEVEEVN